MVVAVVIGVVSTIAAARPPSGTGRQIVERSVTVTLPADQDQFRLNEVVTCPQGTASVNGGYAWLNPPQPQDSFRHVGGGPEGANWRVASPERGVFSADLGSTNEFTLWAICVNA